MLVKRELKQALKSQQEAQINAEHRLIKGKKDAKKSNLGKAEQNFFKNKSEVKSGQNKNKFDRIISNKESELDQNTLIVNYPIHFKFNNNRVKNRRLLKIEKGELVIGEKTLLKDIDFEIYSNQKVLIQGKNGSGKSSFLKKVIEDAQDLEKVYLDQNYSLVNQNLNLEENLKLAYKDLNLTDLYKLLAYFQFSKNDGNRVAKTLSGGELVRLNLAILTLKKVDILILDEHTNNLDISTLEVLLKVLNEYQGALILVCHNAWFCNQIEFDNVYNISDQKISRLS